MSSTDRDHWVLLSNRVPGLTAPSLLGRFVIAPLRPNDNYAPNNPAEFFTEPAVEIEERSASLTIGLARDANAQAELKRLFTFNAGADSSTSDTLQADRVKTYSLQQHFERFDELLNAEPATAKIDRLFERAKGKVYMIVGVRVCSAGSSIGRTDKQGSNLGLQVTVPLSEALGQVIDLGNPQLGGGVSSENTRQSSITTADEQVFALELLVCTQQTRILRQYSNKAPKVLGGFFKEKKSGPSSEEDKQQRRERQQRRREEEKRLREWNEAHERELLEAIKDDVEEGEAVVFM